MYKCDKYNDLTDATLNKFVIILLTKKHRELNHFFFSLSLCVN